MAESRYFERDLSWLQFNHRVLQEAADPSVPLYERLKFLAIYSSNLDEFFRVRVSSLRSLRKMKDLSARFDIEPKKILKEIRRTVYGQQEEFGRIFSGEILPELRKNNIHLINESEFTRQQSEFAHDYFANEIAPRTIPHLILNDHADFFLENRALYLVVPFDENFSRLAIIGLPSDIPRFVVLPSDDGQSYVAFIDDILREGLAILFPGQETYGAYAIKMSRDAELYLGDEFSGDLIARLEQRVKERSKGMPTRFLFDKSMPPQLLKKLRHLFNISKYDVIPGARYHNFNDFFGFPDPSANAVLHDPELPPREHPVLEGASSLISAIAAEDQLLCFPYQKYDYIPALIREAADNPLTEWIRITSYRVAENSEVMEALLYALAKGKKVFAFIEAKARFDEESNLSWGRKLEEAGGRVRYSYPNIKVHAKLLLISFRKNVVPGRIAYLGTGNFNEKTSRLYTDFALLTASDDITSEVQKVFRMLGDGLQDPQCQHIFVSPFSTRKRFCELIDREIANASAGKEAWFIVKMNSLEDREMIDKMYEASRAGVKIQCVIRGFSCMIPGAGKLSENIYAVSIIDRFLEHARVYIFANDGQEETYLASADWMTRNLDRRVEVVFPVRNAKLASAIRRMVDLQLTDNTKARVLDQTQCNAYVERQSGDPVIRAQTDAYEMFS